VAGRKRAEEDLKEVNYRDIKKDKNQKDIKEVQDSK